MKASLFLILLNCLTTKNVRAQASPGFQEVQSTEQLDNTTINNDTMDSFAPLELTAQELLELHTVLKETLESRDRDIEALVKDLTTQIQALLAEATVLIEKEEELLQRTIQVDDKIKQANAIQLEYLAQQLTETVQKELQTRKESDEGAFPVEAEDLSHAIQLAELDHVLNPDSSISLPDTEIANWLLGVVKDEVDIYQRDRLETIIAEEKTKKSKLLHRKCVSPMEAAHLVHTAVANFENDFVGILDHAKMATIVHELTSDTFTPPAQPNELFGRVWWRKYIPVDWERVLPFGWEEWNVALPSAIQHVLGMRCTATVPPEIILDGSILPGACWPMSGSRGNVTIRLPYPVKVSAVTVDHASSLLLDASTEVSSAPRKIRVIGYPPCPEDCRGLGFDLSKGIVLATIDYDKNGRHIQTFETTGTDGTPVGECVESKEIQGSCSAPPEFDVMTPSVSESKGEVSGIKFEVLSNWGVYDYTCLYRLRVHGQAKQ